MQQVPITTMVCELAMLKNITVISWRVRNQSTRWNTITFCSASINQVGSDQTLHFNNI